jgi:type IV pilus assembly protein PilV
MNPSRLSPRGSILIEAMAALAVFSVGIIGVMQMNVLASRQNNLAHSQTSASKIARDMADAFERLPFSHPLLNVPTTLAQDDPEFANMDNPDGLVRLADAAALTGTARPLLGAATAVYASEGDSTFYQVAWRALPVENPARYNQVDQIRVLVMVRFPTPGGGMRQMNTWAIRYNVALVVGDSQTSQEL